jgi:predicted nicotinamide N-methyase
MPVCGCSSGAGCVRSIEVGGSLLSVRQSWHSAGDLRPTTGGSSRAADEREAVGCQPTQSPEKEPEKVPPGLGTCVWEGGMALLRALELSPSLVRGKSVLELGCGTGVVSLACLALGASRVVATDHDAAVLKLARQNAADHSWLTKDGATLTVLDYGWGAGGAAEEALGGPFDVVLGADVTYDPASAANLCRDMEALTARDHGRVVLAFARRPEYRPELLLRSLEELGSWRILRPLSTVTLEPRDAPTEVLTRWVKFGLVVAHACRAGGRRHALEGSEEAESKKRAKWGATDFS